MTLPASDGPPSWPPGLTDSTPLPFAWWRIMHLVDGRRSTEQLAAVSRVAEGQVRQILSEVWAYVGRVTIGEQPLDEARRRALSQCLVAVLGPMGDMLIDDVLDDLPESAPFSAVLASLRRMLSAEHLQALNKGLRSKGMA